MLIKSDDILMMDDNSSRGKSPRMWTPEEDQLLRDAVERFGAKHWKRVAELVPSRSHTQCLQRWNKVLKPGLLKGPWNPSEDHLLTRLVQQSLANLRERDRRRELLRQQEPQRMSSGESLMSLDDPSTTTGGGNFNDDETLPDAKRIDWALIAENIVGRSVKQCRERWCSNLDPAIKKGTWTDEEDRILLETQMEQGNCWAHIARLLPGRTEHSVKTRFRSIMRARKRAWSSKEDELLLHQYKIHGNQWGAIAQALGGSRSKNAIMTRCRQLRAKKGMSEPLGSSSSTSSSSSSSSSYVNNNLRPEEDVHSQNASCVVKIEQPPPLEVAERTIETQPQQQEQHQDESYRAWLTSPPPQVVLAGIDLSHIKHERPAGVDPVQTGDAAHVQHHGMFELTPSSRLGMMSDHDRASFYQSTSPPDQSQLGHRKQIDPAKRAEYQSMHQQQEGGGEGETNNNNTGSLSMWGNAEITSAKSILNLLDFAEDSPSSPMQQQQPQQSQDQRGSLYSTMPAATSPSMPSSSTSTTPHHFGDIEYSATKQLQTTFGGYFDEQHQQYHLTSFHEQNPAAYHDDGDHPDDHHVAKKLKLSLPETATMATATALQGLLIDHQQHDRHIDHYHIMNDQHQQQLQQEQRERHHHHQQQQQQQEHHHHHHHHQQQQY